MTCFFISSGDFYLRDLFMSFLVSWKAGLPARQDGEGHQAEPGHHH